MMKKLIAKDLLLKKKKKKKIHTEQIYNALAA